MEMTRLLLQNGGNAPLRESQRRIPLALVACYDDEVIELL